MSKSLTLADDARLLAIQEAYASALHRLSQAADAKTAENLKSMLAAPLEEIENAKWQANLTSLQSDLLRQNIEETEKLVRGQLYELLDARSHLHRTDWPLKDLKKPLPESGRAALRQMVECLKPLRFIEVRFSEEKMDDYTRDYLRTCEARLK